MSVPYTLVRSSRRTLSLVVEANGELVARAPRRMPLREIEGFIAQKSQWILDKQALQRANQAPVPLLSDGMPLPFMGRELTLRLAEVPFAIAYYGTLLLPRQGDPAKVLKAWLLRQAEALLTPLVARRGEAMGLRPSALRFSAPRTRWGSMNSKGVLRLNLALLLCPPAIVEYVIVHELAHMRQMSHSAAFWMLVEEWMPDYREKRAWLRQNQRLIRLL